MSINIKLVISYDGRAYLGWQKTNMGLSIEEILQRKLEQILQHPIFLQAASRTDAGVHANGQVINFITSKTNIHLSRLQMSLNRLLPKDIIILSAEEMPLEFHPTIDCLEKEYRYFICYGTTQLPHYRFYSWHVPHSLDITAIQQALPSFMGLHNFAAFCNIKKTHRYKDFFRQVSSFTVCEIEKQRLEIRIKGKYFLYKMVRNLVGTLVDVGKRKIMPADIPYILEQGKRCIAGVTAPAHGLFLHRVYY